ncbi:MAG TPA: CDP-alcohol phosphatidyltransferase family protein [Gaiellaceae bacterium]|nr:CDP-alcohol phosphatidyltransferase family protein [Gaiellaceae bacterium]
MHDYGGTMRAVQTFQGAAVVAQVTMGAALAVTVGLSGAGWAVAVACGVLMNAALARGVLRYRPRRLGPADWVTLARATLAVGVAALVADSFDEHVSVTLLVTLSAVALALDAVDGWVARRSRTSSTLGALFDGEVDAFLILVLSVHVARSTGAWVLAIGAARYVFFAAGWLWPWLREPLPPRYWRKVVAATQGIVLTIAAAEVLPLGLTRAALVGALALLAESFGRDVWWLWGHRHASHARGAMVAEGAVAAGRRGRVRAGIAALLTIASILIVWLALVAPDQPSRLTPSAFVRLPLEGLVVVALALALPAAARRAVAWVAGPVLGLLVVVKVLDIGLYTAFDRPFDPIADWRYTGIAIETLSDSVGSRDAYLVVAAAALLIVALLVLTTLAVLRLTRVAAGHRRPSLHAVTALGAAWVLCWAVGAQLVSGVPIASTSAAGLAVDEVRAVRAGIRDRAIFAREIQRDRFRATPGDRLLTSLRGKDVILAFVESYGKVAVQGSSFSPQVDALLDDGTERLRAAGFHARSAFLTSPTFGGASWLAHSTLQSGVWVNRQWRYDQLVASDRFTLSQAFKRAGWRTVDDVPANDRDWPQGSFYGYDKVYDQRNLGYRGPKFAYAPMPDQYVLLALQRHELANRDRRSLFAEVDMVSSHAPWTRIPELVDWDDVGDGSVFKSMPGGNVSTAALWSDGDAVRAAYGRSIEYSLNSLLSFVEHYGDDKLVLVVLGDHQPSTVVTGLRPDLSHDVPISVIAHDPAVLRRIAGWSWEEGLQPSPQAPVWPMSGFRDRFLSAFSAG